MQDNEGLIMAVPAPKMNCAATGIGALPHTDPKSACETVLEIFPEVPYVPTFPNRGLLERIVFSDSEHLPGRVIEENRLWADTATDHSGAIEQIFLDYLEGNAHLYAASQPYASGLYAMMGHDLSRAVLVKCQLTGPVTFGMQVVDGAKRPLHYDPEYADMLGKLIALRARWYEMQLSHQLGAHHTLVVLNEPYLASLGSSVVPLDAEMVRSSFTDVASYLEGSIGIHCCSNTDWSFVMSLSPGVLSFDAYQYAREFLLYQDFIADFMEAGGVVAWGIVPADYAQFAGETADSLYQRFAEIQTRVCSFLDADLFIERSLITPTCGIQFAGEPGAVEIMQATAELSRRVRGD
jgi:hypothetical protein